MVESKLVDGWIPAYTECPFKKECIWAKSNIDNCIHKGKNHSVDFSCGIARGFDLTQRVNTLDETEQPK